MTTPLWAIKGLNKIFRGVAFGKEKSSKAYKVTRSKILSTKKSIKTKYKSLPPAAKASISGFGKGIKYGTLGVGAIEVGKGAYRTITGKKKEK